METVICVLLYCQGAARGKIVVLGYPATRKTRLSDTSDDVRVMGFYNSDVNQNRAPSQAVIHHKPNTQAMYVWSLNFCLLHTRKREINKRETKVYDDIFPHFHPGPVGCFT